MDAETPEELLPRISDSANPYTQSLEIITKGKMSNGGDAPHSQEHLNINDLRKTLREQLEDGCREILEPSGLLFIPHDTLENLITKNVVAINIRAEYPELDEATVEDITNYTFSKGRKVFATLAYMERVKDIRSLLSEGITDDHLPLRRRKDKASEWILEARSEEGRSGTQVRTLDEWTLKDRRRFSESQRLMTSPIFENGGHYTLDDDAVLPFDNPRFEQKKKNFRGGGYSEILIRRPYESHHSFWKTSGVDV